MGRLVTFGIGGYDPTKPNDNIVSDEWVDDDTDSDTIEPNETL